MAWPNPPGTMFRISWLFFRDLIFCPLETGGFCLEGPTGGKLKAGPQSSELKGLTVGTPDSPGGSTSTTQTWSQSLAPNEQLNHSHNVESHNPRDGAGLAAAQRDKGRRRGRKPPWSR